jgi:hypothetical protein
VIAGGTDGGASRSVQKLLEPIGLASFLLPAEKRPAVLFAGNEKLKDEVKHPGRFARLLTALQPEHPPLTRYRRYRPRRTVNWRACMSTSANARSKAWMCSTCGRAGTSCRPPTPPGAWCVSLQRSTARKKASSHVDLGASAAVIAAGFGNKSILKVYPQFGFGENLPGLLNYTYARRHPALVAARYSLPTSCAITCTKKRCYPASIAATHEDLAISQAVARQLHLAMQAAKRDFPRNAASIKPTLTPLFEPILAGGGA